MINMAGKIFIIGIGPGSEEYLTLKAVDCVKNCDYTVGSTRAIDLFRDVKNTIAFNVKDLVDKLEEGVELAKDGNSVAILSTGDPGFSGVLNTVLRISKEKSFFSINISPHLRACSFPGSSVPNYHPRPLRKEAYPLIKLLQAL